MQRSQHQCQLLAVNLNSLPTFMESHLRKRPRSIPLCRTCLVPWASNLTRLRGGWESLDVQGDPTMLHISMVRCIAFDCISGCHSTHMATFLLHLAHSRLQGQIKRGSHCQSQ